MLKNTLNLLELLISSHQEEFHIQPDYILFGKVSIFSFLEELHRRDKNHWLEKGFRYKGIQIILVDAQLQVRNWQYVGYTHLQPVTGQATAFSQKVDIPSGLPEGTRNEGLTYSDELMATAFCHETETDFNYFEGLTIQGGRIIKFSNAITKNQLYSTIFRKILTK